MGGSDFVRNRGYDLYGEKSEGYKQRGFDDFLKLLSGYSGTVMPTTGEQLQREQLPMELASRERIANIGNIPGIMNAQTNQREQAIKNRPRRNSTAEYVGGVQMMPSRKFPSTFV
jgi:hypothetical protein